MRFGYLLRVMNLHYLVYQNLAKPELYQVRELSISRYENYERIFIIRFLNQFKSFINI